MSIDNIAVSTPKVEKEIKLISENAFKFLIDLINQKDFKNISAEQGTTLIYILKYLPSKK